FLPHDWDLDNLEDRIEWAISNEHQRQAIAAEGQRRYTEHTSGPRAGEIFGDHFALLIDDVLTSTTPLTRDDSGAVREAAR
ncbi:MAG: glycosyltransferase, partial [Dehalococcoidia bacterium]